MVPSVFPSFARFGYTWKLTRRTLTKTGLISINAIYHKPFTLSSTGINLSRREARIVVVEPKRKPFLIPVSNRPLRREAAATRDISIPRLLDKNSLITPSTLFPRKVWHPVAAAGPGRVLCLASATGIPSVALEPGVLPVHLALGLAALLGFAVSLQCGVRAAVGDASEDAHVGWRLVDRGGWYQ